MFDIIKYFQEKGILPKNRHSPIFSGRKACFLNTEAGESVESVMIEQLKEQGDREVTICG